MIKYKLVKPSSTFKKLDLLMILLILSLDCTEGTVEKKIR